MVNGVRTLAHDDFDPASDNDTSSEGSANTIRVRQGVTGHGVRYVLAFGLLGILIAFVVVGLYV